MNANDDVDMLDEKTIRSLPTRIVEARRSDTFHADFGPWGSVSCHFN